MSPDTFPIPVLFLATLIVVAVAVEAGYLLGKAVRRRSVDEKESPVSVIGGAILGLAAFMLAFTFSIVYERHHDRVGLVRDDAHAIRIAWQRADFLPERERREARALLDRYLETRLAFTQAGYLDTDRMRSALQSTHEVQNRLWSMAVEDAQRDSSSRFGGLYFEALNRMAEINAMRVAVGIQTRVPPEIWIALYFLVGLGMLVVGYQTAIAESKRSMIQPVLVLSFSVVIALIAMLDRPDSGIMKVTQQPLTDLRAEFARGAAQ